MKRHQRQTCGLLLNMLCDYAVGTGHIFGGEAFERTLLLNLTETKLRTITNYENHFGERK